MANRYDTDNPISQLKYRVRLEQTSVWKQDQIQKPIKTEQEPKTKVRRFRGRARGE